MNGGIHISKRLKNIYIPHSFKPDQLPIIKSGHIKIFKLCLIFLKNETCKVSNGVAALVHHQVKICVWEYSALVQQRDSWHCIDLLFLSHNLIQFLPRIENHRIEWLMPFIKRKPTKMHRKGTTATIFLYLLVDSGAVCVLVSMAEEA